MDLTLRHVVPALAGAIAIRKSCFAASKCCRLKAGLHAGMFMGRVRERGRFRFMISLRLLQNRWVAIKCEQARTLDLQIQQLSAMPVRAFEDHDLVATRASLQAREISPAWTFH